MIKILITGAYCVMNKGDAALRLGGLSHLKELVPSAEFKIMTPFPEIDSKIYKDENVVKAVTSPLKAISVVTRCCIWKIFYGHSRAKNKFIDKLLGTEEIQEYTNSDIIVDISGDSISEVTGFRGTVYHFLHIWMALTLNKPTVVYAQSVGPFKLTKHIAKNLLNKVDLITLRGKISYDYLKEIGVNKPPMYLTADLAFLMVPAQKERIDEIFSSFEIGGNSFIGISISSMIATHYGLKTSYDSYTKLMVNAIDYIVENLDAVVILIPHVTGPKEEFDDRIISENVYKNIKNRNKVILIKEDFPPQEMWGIIERCDMFIGARMHACIGALSTCVPTINISYHHKSNEIMAMFGLEKNVINVQEINFENFILRINDTWKNRKCIKLNIISKIDEIKNLSRSNAEYLKRMIVDNEMMIDA